MTAMRYRRFSICAFAFSVLAGLVLAAALHAQAPSSGSVEFQARIQPSGGRLEPVRSLPFYLLRKSVAEIRKEAEQAEPPVDLDGFVDSLSVSPELKAWMKKNHTVALSGTEFTKKLTPEEITSIPEFMDAFMVRNGASLNAGVPTPKYKDSERLSKPEKYKLEREQYLQAFQHYIATHPESKEGLDAQLIDSNATQRWAQQQVEQQRKIDRRSQLLAHTTYLAAQAESDLEGRGALRGVPPGKYWLTTLDTPALAGDARLQWDVAVQVAPGQIARVDLTNLNAVEAASRPAR
jgi:hypothetical protein